MRYVLIAALSLVFGSVTFAHDHESDPASMCMKDGKAVKIAGKDDKSQKANCASKGGTWEKKKAGKEQSSGDGAGW